MCVFVYEMFAHVYVCMNTKARKGSGMDCFPFPAACSSDADSLPLPRAWHFSVRMESLSHMYISQIVNSKILKCKLYIVICNQ